MQIAIYGAGYVGLVSAVCLAKLGHHVICFDTNVAKINFLCAGQCPIYEAQLPEMLNEQMHNGQLKFTHIIEDITAADIHIIATGTPSLADGHADISQVLEVAKLIVHRAQDDVILVIKSTVPVGTADKLDDLLKQELITSQKGFCCHIVSNPEFLREGTAIKDFLFADRIIIGGAEYGLLQLKTMYQPLIKTGIPIISMSRNSAELSKYSANVLLANKISFINKISEIAEAYAANIDEVSQGIGLDRRIGSDFLQAGIGYGGSCFPKDVRALTQIAQVKNIDATLIQSIDNVNKVQQKWAVTQLSKHFANNNLSLKIGIWGLAFKPGTDDIREASSIEIIKSLLKCGARLNLFDPVALINTQELFAAETAITWSKSACEVLEDHLDALIIATEWPVFKNFCLHTLKEKLGYAPIFDGRNCFDLMKIKAAKLAYYYSVGRPAIKYSEE